MIRRSLLQKVHLTSTSGTICVEAGEEVGINRLPGGGGRSAPLSPAARKSQFFRLRSLATTLVELVRLWLRVVVLRRKAY